MRNDLPSECKLEFGRGVLPCPKPSSEAVNAGVFGFDEQRVVVPSMDDVRTMTEEHARELLGLAMDVAHLKNCWLHGVDPVSGRFPRESERRQALRDRLTREAERLEQRYQDMLVVYAEGFGWTAADALHEFVNTNAQVAPLEPPPTLQQELF